MANFLGLPPELRNRIYDYAIPQNSVVQLSKVASQPQYPRLNPVLDDHESVFPRLPALAGVSRQLRAEVLSVYYGCNTFTSHATHLTEVFLQRLDARSLTRLRDVQVTTYEHSAIKQLVIPNLERVVGFSARGFLSRNAAKVPLRTKRIGRGSLNGNFEVQWVSLAELDKWERDPKDIDMVRRVTWLSRY